MSVYNIPLRILLDYSVENSRPASEVDLHARTMVADVLRYVRRCYPDLPRRAACDTALGMVTCATLELGSLYSSYVHQCRMAALHVSIRAHKAYNVGGVR